MTTAATIWFVAALGIVVGRGDYLLAIGTTVIALAVLTVLQYPERWISACMYRKLEVTTTADAAEGVIARIKRHVETGPERLVHLMASQQSRTRTVRLMFEIRTTRRLQALQGVRHVAVLEGVTKATWR